MVKRGCELRLTEDTHVHLADGMYSFCGFHEFIAIDRSNAILTVIVATDD